MKGLPDSLRSIGFTTMGNSVRMRWSALMPKLCM